MTNRERYEKEILEIACAGSCVAVVDGKPVPCRGTDCEDCDLHWKTHSTISMPCAERRKEWCEAEYVEPPVDWSKVAVDTPILVRDEEGSRWVRRYFAGFVNGHVYAWGDGTTSWSAGKGDNVLVWEFAKLAESEEP